MSGHTPGPWVVGRSLMYGQTTVCGRRPGWDNYVVANTGGSSSNLPRDADLREQQICNARLIAAAPELLEALILVHETALEPAGCTCNPRDPHDQCILCQTESVIAKATEAPDAE